MRPLRTLIALAVAGSLVAVPAATAKTRSVGNANGDPTQNICFQSEVCTYVNYIGGKPLDVVGHAGTLVDWSLTAGSTGGHVQLRVLRPAGHGQFKVVHSSAVQTVNDFGLNKFHAHIKVKRGDVLALTNDSSGLYMSPAVGGLSVHYFDSPIADGSTGAPNQVALSTVVLMSAHVKS